MSKPTETIHTSGVLSATPKAVYDAWLDAVRHAAMTAAPATSDPRVGGRFSAWDGYIEGTDIPPEQGKSYESGWKAHYLTPMKRYFASRSKRPKPR